MEAVVLGPGVPTSSQLPQEPALQGLNFLLTKPPKRN